MREQGVPPKLLDVLRLDGYARLLGIELEEVRPGYARASMEVKGEHRNFLGVTHGGVVFSLADTAFAAASNSHNQQAVAISATIHFLRAPPPGRIIAECFEEHRGSRVGFYRVEVRDESGEVVAAMQALVYRRDAPVVSGG